MNLQSYIFLQARMTWKVGTNKYYLVYNGGEGGSVTEDPLRCVLGRGNIYLRKVPLFSLFPLAVCLDICESPVLGPCVPTL